MIGQAQRIAELKNLEGKKRDESKNIYAFSSGKGGTGKTFVSLNLAYSLSLKGRKVLVIDLDPNLANMDIMLDIKPTSTINEFYKGRSLLKEVITKRSDYLHFIFGDSGRADFQRLKDDTIAYLFMQLSKISNNYDYIFLDTGAGASEDVVKILANADFSVFVTTPEPTSIMDAYVMIKLLCVNSVDSEKLVIVNKCADESEGRQAFQNLNSASYHFLREKLNCLGTIRYDNAVSRSIINQKLFIENNDDSLVTTNFFKLIKNLDEYVHVANINHYGSDLLS
ncbi:MAG: AAA family ATPase [Bacteroidetes bacterium]|nr:AAA family ATPase [Bacteroidota bacterium]